MDHYLLEITLGFLDFPKKQKISCTLSVPACTTFDQLHYGIYEAMPWEDLHLYEFIIHECIEWTKKTRNRACHEDARLLSIMEVPYNMGFGPPEKVSTKLSVEKVLEDARYKGKIIEYIFDGFSHIILVKGKVEGNGNKMELVEHSKWRPADERNSDIREFTDELKGLVVRELSKIACGGIEEDEGSSSMEDSSLDEEEDSNDISDSSDESEEVSDENDESSSEEGSEDSSDEDSELGEELEDRVLDTMQIAVDLVKREQLEDEEEFDAELMAMPVFTDGLGEQYIASRKSRLERRRTLLEKSRDLVKTSQKMMDDLREDLTSTRKRRYEESVGPLPHVSKKSRRC